MAPKLDTNAMAATMPITKKVDKPHKKFVHNELTFHDVLQAARDSQKAFDKFVTTGKLPITR
ncbi:hypothetical protein J2W43_000084 [Pseudomonas brassicacearum]|uniref:Uncharacterized protein n=1 Tax=Pseudomonas brassicacearum TaxID=930166 RepID=A0AAW8M2R4_9PSED|nr:hypothetical protein [Pseudomonas brassicacearum]